MKIAAIIQARYGSSRLPGKVMMDICGKSVLQRVIERVQKSQHVDEVLVATSIDSKNTPIVALCANLGVRVFSGSEDDVLDRYYQLAKLIHPAYLVRVTADCPCFDWTLLDRAIESMEQDTDYMGDFKETLPDGLDLEIMTFQALQSSWEQATLPSEREHVTQYIRKNPAIYKHQNFESHIPDIGHHRWTLDEKEDYTLIQSIYQHFTKIQKTDFILEDILAFLDSQPELTKINNMYARNEGLAKSLQEDLTIEQD